MKRIVLLAVMIFGVMTAWSQTVTTDPVFPTADKPVKITVDVTGTPLANHTGPVYLWAWLPEGCTTGCDAPTNVNPAGSAQSPAQMNSGGTNIYFITITPASFYNKPAAQITKMGFLLKGTDWSNGQTKDMFLTMATSQLSVSFTQPSDSLLFRNSGDVISIVGNASQAANLTLTINGNTVATQAAATSVSFSHTIAETSGSHLVTLTATKDAVTKTKSFTYIVRQPTVSQPRPAGIIDGINYDTDQTKATLSLWAPLKSSVYVIGDFNNWSVDPAYQMKKDGEHFWLPLSGLTAGTEYGFQYFVDEALYVADPYADKILDPDDQYIPATTYPNLKTYPAKAKHSEYYFNRVAVLQTGQTPFVFTAVNYQRPAKEKLVIYELIIRDFFDDTHRSYQSLMDTINYFKRIGVNAIELMPVTEFSGNDSWGYNPEFMFAPDKYYGTKTKLKETIDLFHKNGIAVILDMVMNHQDTPNPYCLMYFDFAAGKPAANNPWFNVNATHPFSVFNDMNHESTYTKKYLDTVNYHWLVDYKFDGLRFDLSKGFTQKSNPTDVNAWGQYDQSRINILERMSDVIWSKAPDAYVILEHFADNSEETVLANYRAAEGKGMMLWANYNYAYNQNTLGNAGNSDFSTIYYANKGWSKPRAVGYMESHDEERLMYNNERNGNSSGNYNVKTLATGLARVGTAAALFLTIPGPKMIWEFGDLGYDKSINTCADGSISTDCRVGAKPVLWSYEEVPERKQLQAQFTNLLKLRKNYSVFTQGDATIAGGNTLSKQITLKNKPFVTAPADSTQMNVEIVANMDVISKVVATTFSHTGTWYTYTDANKTFAVSGASENIFLEPGTYVMFTDVKITLPKAPEVVTGIEEKKAIISIYPNPTGGLMYASSEVPVSSISMRSVQGYKYSPIKIAANAWDVRELPAGVYIAEMVIDGKLSRVKVIKK